MSNRVDLETVCPNNHNQTVKLTREEFENALKSDTLVFHCNTCDTEWNPSRKEIESLRREFAKNEG
jgi:hypothetical protein